MTKQTITTEIDIPDGYEFVRIDAGRVASDYTHNRKRLIAEITIRPIWQPPSWMRPGWIAMDSTDDWYWYSAEPSSNAGIFSARGVESLIYKDGKPTVGEFTPPPCDDWRQSKRRIGGGE